VNDAPALKVANIGIAVEGATDAARAASDIVLTYAGLGVIVDAIIQARQIFQRLRNYVIYRIACTIQLLFFFFISVLFINPSHYPGMSPACPQNAGDCIPCAFAEGKTFGCTTPANSNNTCWNAPDHWDQHTCTDQDSWVDNSANPYKQPSVKNNLCNSVKPCGPNEKVGGNCTTAMKPFATSTNGLSAEDSNKYYLEDMSACNQQFKLPVVAIVLITILNDGTIISIAYDSVLPSPRPEHWRLPEVYIVATLLGCVAVISSILLLHWGLSANTHNSTLSSLGLDLKLHSMSYAKVQTAIYLKISLSDFLTVFAARTRKPFFSRRPGNLLMGAACTAMGSSTLFALYWPAWLPELQPLAGIEVLSVWIFCLFFFILQDIAKCVLYELIEFLTPSIMEMPCFKKDDSIELLTTRLDALESAVNSFTKSQAHGNKGPPTKGKGSIN